MLTNCSVTYHDPFCVILDSIGYFHTPWRRSTKPFTKRLSHCRAKWTCIFAFSAICSPTAQSLTMIRFAWSWTRSDTFTLCEDTPQNRLRNGWAVVELSELVFSHFLPYAHPLLTVTYHDPFCVILDSIGYLHTLWRRSPKPFMKRLSCCIAKSTCISAFSAICSPTAQSLTMIHFVWS